MPGRPRTHHGGEEPDAEGGRPSRARPESGSVRRAEGSVANTIHAGRPGEGGRRAVPQPDSAVTRGTGQPGGTPDGHPTRISAAEDDIVQRSLEMENSGAATIAAQGYQIKQNPSPNEVAQARQATGDNGDPDTRPDYLIEGRVFDCYSPTNPTKSVRGIWFEVQAKIVERQQAQRAVVNLEDWTGDLSALRHQFRDWPIEGLKEVKAILPSGEIVQIDLPGISEGER